MDIEPGKKETNNSEDRKLIVSLLTEYSQKLINVCDKIDIYIKYKALLLLSLILMLVLFSNLFASSDYLKALFSISLVAVCFYFYFFILTPRLRFLQKDAHILCVKVEKLIRVASQAQEHMINNVVIRIEIDLRLADAESALEYYKLFKKKESPWLMNRIVNDLFS